MGPRPRLEPVETATSLDGSRILDALDGADLTVAVLPRILGVAHLSHISWRLNEETNRKESLCEKDSASTRR